MSDPNDMLSKIATFSRVKIDESGTPMAIFYPPIQKAFHSNTRHAVTEWAFSGEEIAKQIGGLESDRTLSPTYKRAALAELRLADKALADASRPEQKASKGPLIVVQR